MNISIGLGARGLKDQDFFTVSDPYVTISRPDAQGGFVKIRTSETKKVGHLKFHMNFKNVLSRIL